MPVKWIDDPYEALSHHAGLAGFMIIKCKDVMHMDDLENWLKSVLKQRDQEDTAWFLSRPSLRHARESQMKELA